MKVEVSKLKMLKPVLEVLNSSSLTIKNAWVLSGFIDEINPILTKSDKTIKEIFKKHAPEKTEIKTDSKEYKNIMKDISEVDSIEVKVSKFPLTIDDLLTENINITSAHLSVLKEYLKLDNKK